MNKYDLLLWWRKVLMSCETEDQLKNALNLWVNVSSLTPCVDDAWNEVINAAKVKLNRLVPPLREYIGVGPTWKRSLVYPQTNSKAINSVFGGSMPACKPPRKP